MPRLPSLQFQNRIYRALDTYTHPTQFTLLQCVQGIGVLLEHNSFRKIFRHHPSREDLQERIQNLLIQARAEQDQQCIREIYDIRYRTNIVLPVLPDQNHELYAQPRRRKTTEKFTLENIASDKENVHNSAINNSVKEVVQNICSDYPCRTDLLESIRTKLSTRKSWRPENNETLNFIRKNPSSFGINCTLRDILYSIFLWITSHRGEQREELLNRLNEELVDMHKMCSTGHMARLVNVLQGYTTNQRYIIGIDIPKEIRKDVFTTLTDSLKNAPEDVIDGIVDKTPEYLEYIDKTSKENRVKWVERFGEEYAEYIDTCVQEFTDT